MYVCNIFLNSIKIDSIPYYSVSNNISRSSIIESLKQLTSLEERLISLHLAFAQIRKLHNCGQYKLVHRSIINVLANIGYTQSNVV